MWATYLEKEAGQSPQMTHNHLPYAGELEPDTRVLPMCDCASGLRFVSSGLRFVSSVPRGTPRGERPQSIRFVLYTFDSFDSFQKRIREIGLRWLSASTATSRP